ncbi:hypothetical protein F7725_028343 [Dissostichus mawsoni]|uniref:Uncharacterized protein n=1 Tax=Dissostichus mawsoni TaxID=36200 RepID=A0A7J5XFF0_DISMA|nr:hypothetical protein F7725_028343 [Dissostichus mawsoni]
MNLHLLRKIGKKSKKINSLIMQHDLFLFHLFLLHWPKRSPPPPLPTPPAPPKPGGPLGSPPSSHPLLLFTALHSWSRTSVQDYTGCVESQLVLQPTIIFIIDSVNYH